MKPKNKIKNKNISILKIYLIKIVVLIIQKLILLQINLCMKIQIKIIALNSNMKVNKISKNYNNLLIK